MTKSKELELLTQQDEVFFNYLKERYPVYNNSNIFLRDIQYGIKVFFEKRSIKLGYPQVESLANSFINLYEEKNIFKKLSNNTWKVNLLPSNNVIVDETKN